MVLNKRGKINMKKIWRIFRRDIKRLSTNIVALIVVGGVCIIPSLYAWFNIAANMDPYSNTGGVPIAVTNNDKGTYSDIAGDMNIGNEIISNLKKNDALGWKFVDESEAVHGVKSGKYYAAIVIPEDFSESMASVLSGNIKRPELIYYLNEKKNAIAPKVTDTGATTIQTQVNTEFVETVSKTVSDILGETIVSTENDIEKMQEDLIADMNKTSENIASYQKNLKSFEERFKSSESMIESAKKTSQNAGTMINNSISAINQMNKIISESRKTTSSIASDFSTNITKGENILSDINSDVKSDLGKINGDLQSINSKVQTNIEAVENAIEFNEKIIAKLKNIERKLPLVDASSLINKLEEQNNKDREIIEALKKGNENISDALENAETASNEISSVIENSQNDLRKIKGDINSSVVPNINSSLDTFSTISGQLNGLLSGAESKAAQLTPVFTSLEKSMEDTQNALKSTGNAISNVQQNTEGVIADLNALKNSQAFGEFMDITGMSADEVADFIATPVKLDTEVFYPVKNYGSAIGTFYTNLAIWVGGIVLIAIFKLEIDKDEEIKSFTHAQGYFGRWILFVVIGLIQSLIICLGDILILKTQCVNPVAFIFAGLVASFVYVNIIYALSITFKHIGKALCVLLVIIQIPGSSGTYPIEMMPGFFQKLNPLLPFTYGINAMREAMAGMYGLNYIKDIGCLLIYVPVFIAIGVLIRPIFLNINRLFDKKLRETGLMICEEEGLTKERVRLSSAVTALVNQDEYRADIYSKVEKFEEKYKKRIKRGFEAIVVIPLILLVLMFSIDAKMELLILWIISIIAISLYIIVVEFIHENLHRKLKMADMSMDDIAEEIRKIRSKEDER